MIAFAASLLPTANTLNVFCRVGDESKCIYITNVDNAVQPGAAAYQRNFSVNVSGVSFSACYYKSDLINTAAIEGNTMLIPLTIYGIR